MPPSTGWKEQVDPAETGRFERYADELRGLQRKNAKGGRASRALHAKGQTGLEATFTVLPDLPEHARVALFANPATYRAYVRFSNGSGAHQPDTRKDVRGVAIKLLGVAGKKLILGMEDATTQDFLLIRTPATPVRNADEFLGLIRMVAAPLTGLPKLIGQLGIGRFLQLLKTVGKSLGQPTVSLATTRYFSALPIQFGPYAVHYALSPHTRPDPTQKPEQDANYLAEELATRLQQGPVSYDFQVQFYVDETRTPIEDASVEWLELHAPFITLARLTLLQQDPGSERGRRLGEFVDNLAFDPWHALREFKPLGNMMRARNHAYRASTQERKAAGEPDGTDRF